MFFCELCLKITCPVWKRRVQRSKHGICRNLCRADILENSPMSAHTFAGIVYGTMHLNCSTATESIEWCWIFPFRRSIWCTNRSAYVHSLASWYCDVRHKTIEMFSKIPIDSRSPMHMANEMIAGMLSHSIQLLHCVGGSSGKAKNKKKQQIVLSLNHNLNSAQQLLRSAQLVCFRCSFLQFADLAATIRIYLPIFSFSPLRFWYLSVKIHKVLHHLRHLASDLTSRAKTKWMKFHHYIGDIFVVNKTDFRLLWFY